MIKQNLRYALPRYAELAFVRWLDGKKPITMVSSWDNVNWNAIETRIRDEQRRRGAARGKLNKEFVDVDVGSRNLP